MGTVTPVKAFTKCKPNDTPRGSPFPGRVVRYYKYNNYNKLTKIKPLFFYPKKEPSLQGRPPSPLPLAVSKFPIVYQLVMRVLCGRGGVLPYPGGGA